MTTPQIDDTDRQPVESNKDSVISATMGKDVKQQLIDLEVHDQHLLKYHLIEADVNKILRIIEATCLEVLNPSLNIIVKSGLWPTPEEYKKMVGLMDVQLATLAQLLGKGE